MEVPRRAEDTLPENQIDILIEADGWNNVPDVESLIRKSVLVSAGDDTTVAILLTNSEKMRELNHQFRGKDYATNVLSFPSDDEDSLGDLALCWEAVSKEAGEQGKAIDDHLMHLVVHGVLHLVGYDHEEDDDAEEMEAKEINILKGLGVKNPYEG